MLYVIYQDAAKQWRWYLAAEDNRKLADSGKAFASKAECVADIALVKSSFGAKVWNDTEGKYE